MELHRCGRCQAVLAEVPSAVGESGCSILDPLVERRLLAAAARHRPHCVPSDPPDEGPMPTNRPA